MAAAELRLRAMGCDAHLLIVGGGPTAAAGARRRLAWLEGRWSRFLPESDVSRLNAAGGVPVRVAPETLEALELAVAAWRWTGGRFDPTVQRALVAAGYDRSFEAILPDPGPVTDDPSPPVPGAGGIALDRAAGTVTLPPDVGVDLGGIGKGLAADLVVADLLEAGAAGACVNLGGDVRVAGEAPTPDGWTIAIEDPSDPARELALATLADGGVATSSRSARRWRRGGAWRHHLLDPLTGRPAAGELAQVTVVAGTGWWAEVLAKAAFLAGEVAGGVLLLESAGVAGLLVGTDGATARAGAVDGVFR